MSERHDRWSWLSRDIPHRDASVVRHLLEKWAALRPDRVFVRYDGGEAWTFRETLEHASRAAAGLSAIAFAGYALSRTTGLPSAKDDIGNWFEPLGLATLFAEAVVFVVSARALTTQRRSPGITAGPARGR